MKEIKLEKISVKLTSNVRKFLQKQSALHHSNQSKGISVAMSLPYVLVELLLSPGPRAIHLKKMGINWSGAAELLDGRARSIVLQGVLKSTSRIEVIIGDDTSKIWKVKMEFFEEKKRCGLDIRLYVDKVTGEVFSGGITFH